LKSYAVAHFVARFYLGVKLCLALYFQGAIMAVGASKPTVLADKDGFFSVKNKMLVSYLLYLLLFVYALMLRTMDIVQGNTNNFLRK